MIKKKSKPIIGIFQSITNIKTPLPLIIDCFAVNYLTHEVLISYKGALKLFSTDKQEILK